MPKYKAGDENRYFPTMIAALIVIAIALATFVVTFLFGTDKNLDEVLIGNMEGISTADPGEAMTFPTAEPNLIPPENPPNVRP